MLGQKLRIKSEGRGDTYCICAMVAHDPTDLFRFDVCWQVFQVVTEVIRLVQRTSDYCKLQFEDEVHRHNKTITDLRRNRT